MIASLDRRILKQSLNGMGGADADRPFRREIRSSYAVAAACKGPPQYENAFSEERLFAGKGLSMRHTKTISPDVDEFFRPKTGLVTRETQKVGQVVQKGPFKGRMRKKGLACLSLCVLC